MSLFGFFKNENRITPFPENGSSAERKDWFSRTNPWHKVSPKIIDALDDKFGDNPLFVLFVITSMEHELVEKYEELGRGDYEDAPEVICVLISTMLANIGGDSGKIVASLFDRGKYTSNKFKKHYKNALNCLETAILLDERQFGAYVQIAVIKAMSNSYDQGLVFINQGLDAIAKIEPELLHMSKIEAFKNAPQDIDDAKKILIEMKESFEQQI